MKLFEWNTLAMLAAMFVAFSIVIGLVTEGAKRTLTDKDGNRPGWFRVGVKFAIPATMGAVAGGVVIPLMLSAVGFEQVVIDKYALQASALGAFLGAGAGAIANGSYQFATAVPWREIARRVIDKFTKQK